MDNSTPRMEFGDMNSYSGKRMFPRVVKKQRKAL